MILITKNKEVFILDLLTRLTLDRWSCLTRKAPFQSQKPFQPSFWSSSFKSTLTVHMRSSFYAFQKMTHNLLMHYYWFLFIKGSSINHVDRARWWGYNKTNIDYFVYEKIGQIHMCKFWCSYGWVPYTYSLENKTNLIIPKTILCIGWKNFIICLWIIQNDPLKINSSTEWKQKTE